MQPARLLAVLAACLAAAAAQDASSCAQPGITATYWNLSSGQAQYLDSQFPFVNGPGTVLSAAQPAGSLVVPQVNFADLPTNTSSPYPTSLSPWPRQPGPNATAVVFAGRLTVPLPGQWTFFVTSSGAFELRLAAANGSALEALGSGGETAVRNGSVAGVLTETQYLMPAGELGFRVEWHHGLPNDPVPGAVLALEWAYTGVHQPTPNPVQIPRQLIPAANFQTNCSTAGAPAGAPRPAPAPAPVPAPSPPPPPAKPAAPVPAPAEPSAAASPPAPGSATCNATFSVQGPYYQDGEAQGVLVLYLSTTGDTIPVPYSLTVQGPYNSLNGAWNWEVGTSSSSGSFSGSVTADWEALQPGAIINLGARLTAAGAGFDPTVVAVNGQPCELSRAD